MLMSSASINPSGDPSGYRSKSSKVNLLSLFPSSSVASQTEPDHWNNFVMFIATLLPFLPPWPFSSSVLSSSPNLTNSPSSILKVPLFETRPNPTRDESSQSSASPPSVSDSP